MVAEPAAVIQILGMPPSVDAEIQRFGTIHLLDTEAVVAKGVKHFAAHAAVPGQTADLVVGVHQAAGYKNDFFAALVLFSVSHVKTSCLF